MFIFSVLDTYTFSSKAKAFEGNTSGTLSTDIHRHVTSSIFFPYKYGKITSQINYHSTSRTRCMYNRTTHLKRNIYSSTLMIN